MKRRPLDPWDLRAEDFPKDGSQLAQWEFFLRYAVLAPSSHNTQPWLFQIRHTLVDLYADRRRACPVVDPDDRELIMSCGCALFHLRAAMRHFGCLGPAEVHPDPHPDLVARVHWGTTGELHADDTRVFQAILERRTNRQPYRVDAVPPAVLTALTSAAESEGAWLRVIDSEAQRLDLAEMVSEGDRQQWHNAAFRQELSKWVHANHSPRPDGIPGYAVGVDDLLSCLGPLVVRTFDMGEGQAARDHDVAMGSPALVVLGTQGNSFADWVAAGQALAHVLLRARADDVWASFLNQPLEVAASRERVSALVGGPGVPQAILRLGYGDAVQPTPRREVNEVLI